MNNWPWEELGLPGFAELPVIRQAYAERLKETRPEENPEGFQRLHSAYQAACRLARYRGAAAESNSSKPDGNGKEPIQGDIPESEPVREWDFERLFAEGAVEERARRFQKLWVLRQKNQSRYDTWRPTPPREPAEAALVWISVSRALSLVEELVSSGAEAPLWNLFCKSELFLYVRNQPDFVFALEDFLRESSDVPEICCQTLFRAYGFDTPPAGREYRLLYQLLKERVPNQDGSTEKSNARPLFRRTRGRLSAALLLLLVALMVSVLNVLVDSSVLEDHRREWVRDWMSEDFGCEFVQAGNRGWGKASVLLDSRTRLHCLARWDGSRDVRRGKRGYVTNYTEVRMSREIADFAAQRNCAIFPERNAGDIAAAGENWSEDYLRFPLTEAGEEISALGDLLSAVKEEAWYQTLPPEYVLYLCWNDWSFYAYDTRTYDFDGTALRRYYERFFGPDLCRIVLEETGIAASDIGEAFSLFPESGSVRLENRDFFHVVGVEKEHFKPRYHYFLSDDGKELFCVPTGGKVSNLTLQELYRMDKADYHVKGFPEPLSVFRSAGEPQ